MAWKSSCSWFPSSSSKTLMPTPSAAAVGLGALARGAGTPAELYDDPPDSVPTNVTCRSQQHAMYETFAVRS